jgi:hypothetical protein
MNTNSQSTLSFGSYEPFAKRPMINSTFTSSLKPTTSDSFVSFCSPPQRQKVNIFTSTFGAPPPSQTASTTSTFGAPPPSQTASTTSTFGAPPSAPSQTASTTSTFGAPPPSLETTTLRENKDSFSFTTNFATECRTQNNKSQSFIRVWKQTPSDLINTNKILAVLSSQSLNEDLNLFSLETLSYHLSNETKTMTTIAPLALLSFVDPSVVFNLPPLQLVFVKFLRELLKEDSVTTVDKAWAFVEESAQFVGLTKILEYISLIKTFKNHQIPKQTTDVDDETSFVLAVYYFLTNQNPRDVIITSRNFSKKVAKLATDMVMASYGLEWLLKEKLCEYVDKHQNTYKIIC